MVGPPPVATGHPTPRGAAPPPPRLRLSVLGPVATADLLTIHHETHGHPTQPPAQAPGSPHDETPPQAAEAAVRQPDRTHPQPPAPAGRHVRLTILGHPTVYPDDSDVALRLPRSAAAPVLVFLALHPTGASTGQLSAALWPHLHPHRTADRLYTAMSTLRRVLDPAAHGPTMIRAGDRYQLNPHHIDVDLWNLHAAVHRAATATDPTDRTQAAHDIITLYQADLAPHWPWPWLDAPREQTRRHLADAYATLAAQPIGPAAGQSVARH
jgi:hypothetical protein